MKKLFTIVLFGLCLSTEAQTILFQENFDLPSGPDSVSTYNINPALSSRWNDTTFLASSSSHSYHTQAVPFDSVIFETQAFSTLGKRFVQLRFNHIAKVHFGQRCYIQLSVNNGTTWTNLSGNEYNGESPQFGFVGFFNELSYPSPSFSPYWGGLSITNPPVAPTNSWWAAEMFDLSNLAGTIQSNGDTGYAQVKLRFIASHQINTFINPSGWYVDDVEVIGSTCELTAPEISYNHPNASKPVGFIYSNANFNCKVADKGANASGVSGATLHYRINGGAWQSNAMTPQTGTSCPDSTQYSFQLSTPAIGDTVDWYITAADCGCGNITRDPGILNIPHYYTYWRTAVPPGKCGLPNGSIYPFVITSLPYFEDFESTFWQEGSGTGDVGTAHRGIFPTGNPPQGQNWIVTPNTSTSGYAWSIRDWSTGTPSTGPSFNHTSNGSNFVYTEASQPGSVTQLIMPCVDLENESCAVLEFYTHMYGSDINTLRVDVDTSNTNVYQWQNAVWIQVGELQQTSNAPWQRAVVPLDEFSGKIVRIRFVGFRGNGDKGDMAIDDIRIFSSNIPDVSIELTSDLKEERCTYSANEPITARVQYVGCVSNNAVPLAYVLTDVSNGTTTTVWDTLYTAGNPVIDTLFTFATVANIGTPGQYSIQAFAALPADTLTSNDTSEIITIDYQAPFSAFPYLETFDEAPWEVGLETVYQPGIFDTSVFKVISIPNSNAWVVGKNNTPNIGTGPSGDYTTQYGQYLFFASTGSPLGASYQSRCLDFSSLQNPHLSFWYHMYGADCAITVQVKADSSNSWTSIPGGVIFGQQQTSASDDWKFLDLDLSAYAGSIVQVRIISSNPNQSYLVNTAIDNLMIYDKGSTDVGVAQFLEPLNFVSLPATSQTEIRIQNVGTNAVANVPVTFVVQPYCGSTADTVVMTSTATTASGATTDVQFSTTPNYVAGDLVVKAFTNLPNDANPYNDTLVRYITGREAIDISQGYFQDFESCDFFSEGYLRSGESRLFNIQEINQPPLNSAYSGDNALALTDWKRIAGEELILLPPFIGFDSVFDAQITFWQNRDFDSWKSAVLEFYNTTSSNWEALGYPILVGSQRVCDSVYDGTYRWHNNSQGWEQYCISLSRFNYSTLPVFLRFRAISGSNSVFYIMDWAIDDIAIEFSRKPYDLSTDSLALEELPTELVDSVLCQIEVSNKGMLFVQSFELHYAIDGNSFTPAKLVSTALASDQSQIVSFRVPVANLAPGQHELCVWAANPNGKPDELSANDTTCMNFELMPVISQLPYCPDFDTQKTFTSETDLNPALAPVWSYGTPGKPGINQAYSGTTCWITGTSQDYENNVNEYLYTPPFNVVGQQCYQLSFYQNFITQNTRDGGNVQFSLDTGKTWNVLGKFGDFTWYNHPYVYSLGLGVDGFSGTSNGWQLAFWQGGFVDDGAVMFRFHFASDFAVTDQGWAIDDFCFEPITGNCTIGVGEGFSAEDWSIYPVPANTDVIIQRGNSTDEWKVTIWAAAGVLLDEFVWTEGSKEALIDVSNYSNGVYWVKIESAHGNVTKPIVIQR